MFSLYDSVSYIKPTFVIGECQRGVNTVAKPWSTVIWSLSYAIRAFWSDLYVAFPLARTSPSTSMIPSFVASSALGPGSKTNAFTCNIVRETEQQVRLISVWPAVHLSRFCFSVLCFVLLTCMDKYFETTSHMGMFKLNTLSLCLIVRNNFQGYE